VNCAADIRAEIQQRDRDHHASLLEEISQLKATAARVDQLEKDNQALVQELDQLRRRPILEDIGSSKFSVAASSTPEAHPVPLARPALAEKDANSHVGALDAGPPCSSGSKPNWEKEYAKLAMRYTALEQRHDETQRSARRYRESRDNWMRYAESLEVKVKKMKRKPPPRHEKADDRTAVPISATAQRAQAATGSSLSGQTALESDTSPTPEPLASSRPRVNAAEEPLNRAETTPASPTVMPSHIGGSAEEETEDEGEGAAELPPIPPDMATDFPTTIKQEPSSDLPVVVSERTIRKRKHPEDHVGTPTPARRIKSEQSTSSDPVVTGEAAVFCPHESIDLDDEENGMPTPRRQRLAEHQHLREEGTASPVERRLPGAGSDRNAHSAPSPGLDTGPAAPGQSTHKFPRTHQDRKSPIKARWTLNSGIADVAEETVESFYSPTPHKPVKGSGDRTLLNGRLHSLLNQGSPNKAGGYLPPTRPVRDNDNAHLDEENIENISPHEEPRQRQDLPIKPSPLAKGSLITSLKRHAREKASPQKPTRLRDRPLAELRPEDFKVNPKANNGYRYAFDEVVRNRDERSELAGCTDPNCCGRQFRAMAESELSASGPGVLSRAPDTRMMEDYLGDQAYRLVEMTTEERREVWLKARTQDLANRLGRHRHRFARRPTPPGFWNPDFPSTQEIEQRKEEAEKAERGLVEERWREAMRAGGRWLFRDE
jgi:hypothetical protein